MSGIYTLNAIGHNIWGASFNDEALQPPDYVAGNYDNYDGAPPLWASSSMLGVAEVFYTNDQQRWEQPPFQTGQRAFKKISGVARDSAGAPIAGVTVQLFNTTTGLLVDTQTSAADGSYTLNDPNNTTNFEVAYLPGSPDRAGTSRNNLTGS